MTVSIGGVALSEDLTLQGLINESKMLLSVNQTLGGGVVTRGVARSGGRELILEAVRDGGIVGFFTGEQAAQLAAIRDSMQAVELVHHLGAFVVIITAIDLKSVTGVVDPSDETLYYGSINMLEI
jgi:hypothetical protein